MSTLSTIQKDFSELKTEWSQLDSTLKTLDILSIVGVLIFGIAFILASTLDSIQPTVTNMSLMVYPVLISGYVHILRQKIAKEDADISKAKREFLLLSILTTFLIFLGLIYGIALNA